jgi:hypothetical protein
VDVPVELLSMVPDGYYAVRLDSNEAWTFIRLSKPKTGFFKAGRKVQTQHSDALTTVWGVTQSGKIQKWMYHIDDLLIELISNYQYAALKYGQIIGKCCRCGKKLTDARSRWYSIGPECEGYSPWVIDWVNDSEKGPYTGIDY